MSDLFIKSIRIVDPSCNRDEIGNIIIRNGTIQPDHSDTGGLKVFDGNGMIAAPGFWDVHVHFRDPGNPLAETQRTGSLAAAAGGFTHVVTMPNTAPAMDTPQQIRSQLNEMLPVKILPSGCISAQRSGRELANLPALINAGAVALTDDGAMLTDDELMRKAMKQAKQLNTLIMEHAVIPSLAGRGMIKECEIAKRYNLPIFPPEAEIQAVRRDITLCRETECPIHIQHISCGESVELIRQAQKEGLPVTGEASPHHLAIAVEDLTSDDGNFRMNPPLGNRNDVRSIRDGVLDGTLAMFATDHAPHTSETKTKGFLKAAFGIIGLETAIGVTWKTMIEEEQMNLMQWISCWTSGPAKLLHKPEPNLLAGSKVDMVIIDPSTPWKVDPAKFKSLSRNTPFTGWGLRARPIMTFCEGRRVYNEQVR